MIQIVHMMKIMQKYKHQLLVPFRKNDGEWIARGLFLIENEKSGGNSELEIGSRY